ncbi:MAG: DNA alkylation repair protein [Blastocatellia bacterium]|nr:DNA alkylation repair protein [Blastocatellia bacterium]
MSIKKIREELKRLKSEERARALQRFFKTGPGQYGEGDRFLGIRVPDLRRLVGEFQSVTVAESLELLRSPLHEERLLALLVMVRLYAKGDRARKKEIFEAYLENTRFINNWDLVDASASQIVGDYLSDRSRKPLYALAGSSDLWERRISIIATFHFIRRGEFDDTLKVAEILLSDREDLIHKAVGWMLREVGKRNLAVEEDFLKRHYAAMPRTMLRYAIEKFPETRRQMYLKGNI